MMLPNEVVLGEAPSEGHSMSGSDSMPSSRSLGDMLACSYNFLPDLEAFLSLHPHYEPLRDTLETVCRLACTACAMLGTSILDEQYSTREVIDGLKSLAERYSDDLSLEEGTAGRVLSKEDIKCIIDYLRAFDYVYQRKLAGETAERAVLSSLPTLGYVATMRALEKNHPFSLNRTGQILHEFVLPLLNTVFRSFTSERKSTVN